MDPASAYLKCSEIFFPLFFFINIFPRLQRLFFPEDSEKDYDSWVFHSFHSVSHSLHHAIYNAAYVMGIILDISSVIKEAFPLKLIILYSATA